MLTNVIGLTLQSTNDNNKVLEALNKGLTEEKKFTEWSHESFTGIEKRGIMLLKVPQDSLLNLDSKIKEAGVSNLIKSIGRVVYFDKGNLATAAVLLDQIIVDLKPGSTEEQLAEFSLKQGLKIVRKDLFVPNRYYLQPVKEYTDPLDVIEKSKKYKSFEHILPGSIMFNWSTPIEHPR